MTVDHQCAALSLQGQRRDEQYNLPPDTRAIEIASPGEYRLRQQGRLSLIRTTPQCFQFKSRRSRGNEA